MTNTLEYSPPQSRSGSRRAMLPAQLGPLIGLLLVTGFFAALRHKTFASASNLQVMLTQTAVVGAAALGMTLIIISGGIDLSVGSCIALTCVVVAKLLEIGAAPIVAVALGMAAGCLAGMLIGVIVTQIRLAPFIVTLGTWGAFRSLAKGFADESTITPDPTWINDLLTRPGEGHRWMLVPPGVWVVIILAVVMMAVLRYTRFGRHVFAIGSNEQTARLCGVGVGRTKIMVYAIGGLFAGVAGVLQYSYLGQGDPTTAAGYELDIIAAVVIGGASLSGGQGTILGTLVGAMLMTVVANGCSKLGMRNWVQEGVTGVIIILAAAIDRMRPSSR
ncbi:MAG: transporter permease [Phycisphaerales bacterium]|jgi:ribose transport system permease protein|nr:transporter permease [Phycisphaerales bacterium]